MTLAIQHQAASPASDPSGPHPERRWHGPDNLEPLDGDARYHRDRLALYRARECAERVHLG